MGKVRFSVSVSLDGFLAGPEQSLDNPLGIGGEALHEWAFSLAAWRAPHGLEGGEENASTPVLEEMLANVGAYLMGRNMFGGGPGPWSEPPWNGWWGENPPFHVPVFVLTHHPREPLELAGGTTFYFVTGGSNAALALAREAAGDRDVVIAGGADAVQQYLRAGVVDEFTLSVAPLLLGGGTRLLEGVGGVAIEQIRVIEAPGVCHLTYRVRH